MLLPRDQRGPRLATYSGARLIVINARFSASQYDNVVKTIERSHPRLEPLNGELSRKTTSQTSTIHVFAERADLGAAASLMVSNLGFAALNHRNVCASDLDRGLMLIVGDSFAPEFLTDVLTGPWTARLERVVLFGNRIGMRTLAALDEIGFAFIVKSLPSPERLSSILVAVDPSMLAAGQATMVRRMEASSAIETGSDRLFEHIRTGNLGAAISEAKTAFNHFEALLDSAAAAHWLSIIQQYHHGTAQHCSLVSAVAMLFARSLGFSENDQRRLFEAAHFHDVGKVNIPLEILDKPGWLDPSERSIMETHANVGYEIISLNDAIANEVADVARNHHEYLDGSGYPRGIRGRQITDIVRIITICDIFAALIERRSYKQPKSAREAYSILQSLDGKLDASLLRSFSCIAASCSSD